jgi:hypothetical protein
MSDSNSSDRALARLLDEPGGSDRRVHQRISSSQLRELTFVHIPNQPTASLIDLSAGGALLTVPFQMRPGSRTTLELVTADERLAVPFQLLRCWVADVADTVRYYAAGSFDRTLHLGGTLADELVPATPDRLLAALEALQRSSQTVDLQSRGTIFNDMLSWVVAGVRLRRPAAEISTQIKARLVRLYSSLIIEAASRTPLRDPSASARFFGLDFRSADVLSAADRRFLRASAQLISLVNGSTIDREPETTLIPTAIPISSLLVHSMAEWQALSVADRPA